MKQFCTLLMLFVCFKVCSGQEKVMLFNIIENERYGFINAEGHKVIRPVFRAAGPFSEGLAPVRIDSGYGYINETGAFAIAPQFDYGTNFREGFAIVYKDGCPLVIDQSGKCVFKSDFAFIGPFENGKAIVRTRSEKLGLINTRGQLIIDTAFAEIGPFTEGWAIVQGVNHHPYNEDGVKAKFEIGVMDTQGKWIVPYGRYKELHIFGNGYIKFEIPIDSTDEAESVTVIKDKSGKIIGSRTHQDRSAIGDELHYGLAKIYLHKKLRKGSVNYNDGAYMGFVTPKATVVMSNTTWYQVSDFSEHRAFVKNHKGIYSIINTSGTIIARDPFDYIQEERFVNGLAFARKGMLWGIIDTNAKWVLSPRYQEMHSAGIINGYFFFQGDSVTQEGLRLYGIGRTDGSTIMSAVMDNIDRSGFKNGLLKCVINNRWAYVNEAGKIVWQQADSPVTRLANLNIDYRNRCHFYAYSAPDSSDLGGFGGSENIPKKIAATNRFPLAGLSITVYSGSKDTFQGYCLYNALTVCVANTSGEPVKLNAQDSRLDMIIQALHPDGNWKDIEYQPNSWCGNSYHTLTLNSGYYWQFKTPVYEGSTRTKLRIRLRYIDPKDKHGKRWEKQELAVYSNEFDGSINAAQFWRRPSYTPGGIMDPYNE